MKKAVYIISRFVAICLVIFSILAFIGLCFASGVAKWFLLGGGTVAMIALLFYVRKVPFCITTEKVITKIVEQAPQPIVVAPIQTESNIPQQENKPSVDNTDEVDKISVDDTALQLMRSLENNHINVFETHLTSSEVDDDVLLEEFVDTALLAMDLVNIHTRTVSSFKDITVDLINNDCDKQAILSRIDPSIRLSMKYNALRRILQNKLPGRSFFYSGYKI